MTKLSGNHTIKFGGDYRHNSDYLLQTQDQGGPRGFYTFNGGQTGVPNIAATQNNVGNAMAAFLLDRPSSAGRDLAVIDKPGTVYSAVFSFIHDKWQVSPKLTLDLGLRHEYYTPFVGIETQGGLSNYDPATNSCWCRATATSPRTRRRDHLAQLEPAHSACPIGSTTSGGARRLRVEHDPVRRQHLRLQLPGQAEQPVQRGQRLHPAARDSMAAGFPAPVVAQIPSNGRIDAGADPRLRNGAYFYFPTDLKEGLLHSWNVAYQRELGANFTAEVAYVANHGQDIIQRLDLNAGYTLGAGNAGRPQFAPFGRTSSVTAFLPYHTDYQSMQVKVDRRFRNGFLITNSYTLGKGESYDGGDSNGSISTPIDIERSWGRTVNDRTAHLRQQLRLRPAVPEGGLARRRRQRLADVRALHGPVGPRPRHHDGRGAAQHAGQHAAAEHDRRSGDPRERRRRQTWFDTTRVRGAGGEHVRQPDPQRRRRQRARLLQPRRLAREEDSPSATSSRRSASTHSTSPTRCTPTTRTPRSAARRSGRSPARPIRASCGSASVSCSRGRMARRRTHRRHLATLDDDARRTLEAVRASIRKAAPAAEGDHQLRLPGLPPEWEAPGMLSRGQGALLVSPDERPHRGRQPRRAQRLRDERRHDPLSDRHAAAGADRSPAGESPDRGDGWAGGQDAGGEEDGASEAPVT